MAWYRTGTVAVTLNGTTVTGTGTNFVANSRIGDDFIGPDGRNYEIINVASPTTLALGSPYLGATVTGGAYAIMPVNGYSKLAADELRALGIQAGDKLNALGTTGNYDILPVLKGGTGATTGVGAATNLGLNDYTQKLNVNGFGINSTNNTIKDKQGGYLAWNESGVGDFTFICNKGAGTGGFVWRTVNADNTLEIERMSLAGGILTVPRLTLNNFLTVANGGTGGNTQATARAGLGLGSVAIESVVPQTKGGTGRGDGRVVFSEIGAQQPSALYNTQGTYIGWNATGAGEAHFICNQGGGTGGFNWRTVNAGNTTTGPSMFYAFNGVLTIPAGPAPAADGGANCGQAGLRWATVFAVTGAINTSDAREKTEVSPFSNSEIAASMLIAKEIGSYKWLSSVSEKGEGARKHVGTTVQRVMQIMQDNGLNPTEYAFICYDEWEAQEESSTEEVRGNIYSVGDLIQTDVLISEFAPYQGMPSFTWEETSRKTVITKPAVPAGNRYGFRYDQLSLFIARGQEERLARLEALLSAA